VVSIAGAWLGGGRFEVPTSVMTWRAVGGVTRVHITYAHCFDLDWAWWYPVTDAELELARCSAAAWTGA
jgi:hypothetical protein